MAPMTTHRGRQAIPGLYDLCSLILAACKPSVEIYCASASILDLPGVARQITEGLETTGLASMLAAT